MNVPFSRSLCDTSNLKYLFKVCNNDINCIDVLGCVDVHVVGRIMRTKAIFFLRPRTFAYLRGRPPPCSGMMWLINVFESDWSSDYVANLHRLIKDRIYVYGLLTSSLLLHFNFNLFISQLHRICCVLYLVLAHG